MTAQLTALRVLVVDDDAFLLGVIRHQLERTGCIVSAVSTPSAAIALVESGAIVPDVVLTDHDLGETSGHQLVAALRQRHPAVRAVLMSGSAQPHDEPDAGTSRTPFLLKPFSIAQLLAVLETPPSSTADPD